MPIENRLGLRFGQKEIDLELDGGDIDVRSTVQVEGADHTYHFLRDAVARQNVVLITDKGEGLESAIRRDAPRVAVPATTGRSGDAIYEAQQNIALRHEAFLRQQPGEIAAALDFAVRHEIDTTDKLNAALPQKPRLVQDGAEAPAQPVDKQRSELEARLATRIGHRDKTQAAFLEALDPAYAAKAAAAEFDPVHKNALEDQRRALEAAEAQARKGKISEEALQAERDQMAALEESARLREVDRRRAEYEKAQGAVLDTRIDLETNPERRHILLEQQALRASFGRVAEVPPIQEIRVTQPNFDAVVESVRGLSPDQLKAGGSAIQGLHEAVGEYDRAPTLHTRARLEEHLGDLMTNDETATAISGIVEAHLSRPADPAALVAEQNPQPAARAVRTMVPGGA